MYFHICMLGKSPHFKIITKAPIIYVQYLRPIKNRISFIDIIRCVRYTEFVCKIVRVCVFYKVPIFIEKLSAVYRVILMVTNAFILRYYVCLFYLYLYPTILVSPTVRYQYLYDITSASVTSRLTIDVFSVFSSTRYIGMQMSAF